MESSKQLWQRAHALPFNELLGFWDEIDSRGTDKDAIRELCRNDRYYLLIKMLRRYDAWHPWIYERCREVEADTDDHIDIWAREHYKAVMLKEPVLTPRGWTTHGALRPGDEVYGADGKPTKVVAVTKVFIDARCFRVRFDDGSAVTVSAQHLWTIERRTSRRVDGISNKRVRERITVDTETLAEDVKRRFPISIPLAGPVEFGKADLPLDPYLLGAWLGDGHSHSARFTCSTEDFPHWESQFVACGHTVTVYEDRGTCLAFAIDKRDRKNVCVRGHLKTPDNVYRLGCKKCKADRQRTIVQGVGRQDPMIGFAGKLRELGLYNNKHIPSVYLHADSAQRMSLLQGLMDTDGTCDKRGNASYCSANARLAAQVLELALSLGIKARIQTYDSQIVNGAPYVFYTVAFSGDKDNPPFRMERKRLRCSPRINSRYRYISSIEPVDTVPVSCIQVAAEDGLYLVGRNLLVTHNSTIITFAGAIQEILRDADITIGIFSHTKPIAKGFLAQIQREFESNQNLIAAFPDVLYANPVKDAPSWSLDAGLIVRRRTNPKEATLEAHGLVDGQPTSKHFRLMIYNDVVTRESVNTPEQIAKTTEAWELSNNLAAFDVLSGEERPSGRRWIEGTRYHYADTYAAIIERGAAKPRIRPATDDGTLTGNPVLLTPAQWTKKLQDQGEATAACQLLANPLAGHQRMFDVNDLVEYEVRPETLMVYILIDPARSVKKDSAHTAMIVLGLSVGGAKFLLDGFDHKMDLTERWTNMRDLWWAWGRVPGVQGVKVGYEKFGAQADLDYFQERMREERVQFDITELGWPRDGEGAKNDRVQRLTPDLRNHRIYVPYDTDPENMTRSQRRMKDSGYEYRISRPIKKLDENRQMYDLTERLRLQVGFFPFCERKDVIDALSRVYDMEPTRPEGPVDPLDLEPDVV